MQLVIRFVLSLSLTKGYDWVLHLTRQWSLEFHKVISFLDRKETICMVKYPQSVDLLILKLRKNQMFLFW